MANTRSQNTFYVDTASASGTAGSWIDLKGAKVAAILFTSSVAGDTLTLSDLSATSVAAGSVKLTVRNVAATDSKFLNFYECPLSFPNGIWVSAISASCTATLVIMTPG